MKVSNTFWGRGCQLGRITLLVHSYELVIFLFKKKKNMFD